MSTRVEIAPIDAARLQLDWAIRLLLDHSASIPAITLAAAAEELSGKCVGADASKRNARDSIKHSLASRGYGSPDEIGDFMNQARNSLKHHASGMLDLEPEPEAIQLITRAIINMLRIRCELSTEITRFLKWVQVNRPDLLECDAMSMRRDGSSGQARG
jgi:hypothetical protein